MIATLLERRPTCLSLLATATNCKQICSETRAGVLAKLYTLAVPYVVNRDIPDLLHVIASHRMTPECDI